MKYSLYLGLLILILLISGFIAIFYFGRPVMNVYSYQGVDSSDSKVVDRSSKGTLTLDIVAEHADKSSCWAVVDNSVYDLTTFISRHPGGSSMIVDLCGTDASAKYKNQHGRSSSIKSTLILLKIGELSL